MREINYYYEAAYTKYREDREITGISFEESVDFVVRQAYINDEIEWESVKLLKQRLLKIYAN